MVYGVLFEKIQDTDFEHGYYYAHIPSLGLTTHGLGVEGAKNAAKDLISLWIAEKKSNNEIVANPVHTGDMPEGTLRSILKLANITLSEFQEF